MKRIIFCTFLAGVFALKGMAQQGDTMLRLLKDELRTERAELQNRPDKPYFMSYRVEDSYQVDITSAFGSTMNADSSRTRSFVPQIRLGDMKLDNFKYATQGGTASGKPGKEYVQLLPLDCSSPDAVRTAIWKETLRRYNIAQSHYKLYKTRALTSVANEDTTGCFSPAPKEVYYEAPADVRAYQLGVEKWAERLNRVSAVFKSFPQLTVGEASMSYSVKREWIVNTDRTEIAQNRIVARIILSASLNTSDGMQLPLNKSYLAYQLDSLPSDDVMIADVKDMITRLRALQQAPVANPYTGPAILSGAASGVFFHEIFGHRLEGHRLKEGGETFKNMVGKSILPATFNVVSDPTLSHYAGSDMNGHYLYDSEGVKARRVVNVDKGVLKSFLTSRVPLEGFPVSNGHGRAAMPNDAVSRQSNLIVETTKPYTDSQLKAMLRAEAKKQGKEYGYFFKTVTSGFTLTGEGGSLNSFNVTPLEVYRVYVDGRKDELVRGVDLIGTPLSMFSHIIAGGGNTEVFTGSCGAESGWVPVACASPAVFVSQVETQRRGKSAKKLPSLSAPSFSSSTSDSDNVAILKAMEEELKRTCDSLRVADAPRPFYVSYIANRYRQFNVSAELGAIVYAGYKPWRSTGSARVLVGNFRHNSEPWKQMLLGVRLPSEVNIPLFRRAYWVCSDEAYDNALRVYVQKNNFLVDNPMPADLKEVPDMQRMAPVRDIEASFEGFDIDTLRINTLLRSLSATFHSYKNLYNSSVSLSGYNEDIYRTTSERVILRQPVHQVTLKVTAMTRSQAGVPMKDEMTLEYASPADLPAPSELERRVKAFADGLDSLGKAAIVSESYEGPVLYTGDAASLVFSDNLLRPGYLYAQQSINHKSFDLGSKIGKEVIDRNLSVKNYTSMDSYHGTKLIGAYSTDADGMRPQPEMTIIDKGKLLMQLNGTAPSLYAPRSTGSARWHGQPQSTQIKTSVGTLHVFSAKPMTMAQLTKSLLKEGKKAHLDYVYEVNLPEGCSFTRIYRINVNTGERTLMVSPSVGLPKFSQLESIGGVSREETVTGRAGRSFITPYGVVVNKMQIQTARLGAHAKDELTYPLQR